ncbi:ATP-binding protein [Actinoplanes sp. TRM 88003]|uniref:ATP-binding protein n=1 Tax=Paractinoplanes aksuensis TaxID=2939490 RepID=A0ABT1DJQ8_9ACTN|nr:ATP-binding protein [Actinoplanes aksuensis]MCO8271073.1 ATP-binding protein [Actinoplanes aksuensis]
METLRWPDMGSRHSSGGSVVVTADADNAVTIVTVRGIWGTALRSDAFIAVRKVLGEHPAALILDLCECNDRHAAGASTWLTVCRVAAAMMPPVRVAACLQPRSALNGRLVRMGGSYFLPLFSDLAGAAAAVRAGGPVTDRLRLSLPPHPDTPALARNLVTDACSAWGLPEVLYPARLVMSELAGNAVEHARTPIAVIVVRRGVGLHLMVCDGDPRLPRVIDQTKEPPGSLWDLRGQGLRIVRTAAAAWGALPTRDGKMVWATIHP